MRNLTPEQVSEIPKMVRAGLRMREIAERLGISKSSAQGWITKYRRAMREKGDENPLPMAKGRPPMRLNI